MKKIKTIFERDLKMKITTKQVVDLTDAIPTEKVDGTNIRITVRNHTLVRIEKRRNPSKLEKAKGIITPWYEDADEYSPNDKYVVEAARCLDISDIEDGEFSGEAYGEKIQGNPLKIEGHRVFLFSHAETLKKHQLNGISTGYEILKRDLSDIKSTFNPEVGIEGIVFWRNGEPIGKIKVKDFRNI